MGGVTPIEMARKGRFRPFRDGRTGPAAKRLSRLPKAPPEAARSGLDLARERRASGDGPEGVGAGNPVRWQQRPSMGRSGQGSMVVSSRMPSETDLARRALELKIEEGLKSVREGRVVDGEEAMAELIGELKTRRKTAKAKR